MYFHFHSKTDKDPYFNGKLQSIQCEAVKSNAQRCKNHTVIGQTYCHAHRKKMLHLQIKKSTIPGAGQGLFAAGDEGKIIFKTGDRICMYNGQLLNDLELLRRYREETAPYAIELHKKDGEVQYEDAATRRGIGSLANHSRNKSKINARLSISRNNRAQLIATKNIRSGAEILVDYGPDYGFDDDVCTATNRSKKNCY